MKKQAFLSQDLHKRLADLNPPPKYYFYGVGLFIKISPRSVDFVRRYSTFSQGETGTLTPIVPFIYRWVKILMPFLIPFIFTMFPVAVFLIVCDLSMNKL